MNREEIISCQNERSSTTDIEGILRFSHHLGIWILVILRQKSNESATGNGIDKCIQKVKCMCGSHGSVGLTSPKYFLFPFSESAYSPKIFSQLKSPSFSRAHTLRGLISFHSPRLQWLLTPSGSTISSLPRSDHDHHHLLPMEFHFNHSLPLQPSFHPRFCSLLLPRLLQLPPTLPPSKPPPLPPLLPALKVSR